MSNDPRENLHGSDSEELADVTADAARAGAAPAGLARRGRLFGWAGAVCVVCVLLRVVHASGCTTRRFRRIEDEINSLSCGGSCENGGQISENTRISGKSGDEMPKSCGKCTRRSRRGRRKRGERADIGGAKAVEKCL